MTLESLFPLFRGDFTLYDDGSVIVIDKPPGLPTHETSPGDRNHTVFRLAAHLKSQGERDYLGIHQRLDKDTSGVLLFSRAPEHNRALAAEFEGHKVHKEYVACVLFPPKAPKRATLVAWLTKEKGGKVSLSPHKPKHSGASKAITHYRVIEMNGERALLSVIPETGRMHQIRAQLAHAGMPVAGDTLYSGPPASRLLLHASRLELRHPSGKGKIDVTSPTPDAFRRWLANDTALPATSAEIEARLRRAADKRAALFHELMSDGEGEDGGPRRATTAFRLCNGAGDDLPGTIVDLYDRYLVVSLASPEAEAAKEAILDAAFALGAEGVYLKNRPKHASVLSDKDREERAPKEAVRGKSASSELTIRESGLEFLVQLGDGLQTGIFLDQRDNRVRVRELSRGLRVLNLFAYTGTFSVAAAAGGASQTVTVDVAKAPLVRAQQNLDLLSKENACPLSQALLPGGNRAHSFLDVDALVYLKGAQKRGEEYDLVIVDPPSFATTKTSTFSVKDDLKKLLSLAFGVTAPGGRLLVSINHRKVPRMRLRRIIYEAARDAGKNLSQVKDLPGTIDFPNEPGFEPAMKSVLVSLGDA